jgi:hypothetical protein
MELGLGRPRSEYDVVETRMSDERGRVAAVMEVPRWAATGDRYVFVVATTEGGPGERVRAVSDPFIVEDAGATTDEVLTVVGTLTADGVECPVLTTAEGSIHTLVGGLGSFETGERVRVTGVPVEMSMCMQGETLRVRRIEAAPGGG